MVRARVRFRPAYEVLETRALAAITMSINPTAPNLGNQFTCTLNPGGAVIANTIWDYQVSYGGIETAATVCTTSAVLSANIIANVPGEYSVTATVSFPRVNGILPAPTSIEKTVNIPVPTTVTPTTGLNTPIEENLDVMVTSTVSTGLGVIGPFVAGVIQENIPYYVVLGDKTIEGTGGWYPPNGVESAQFALINGRLYDAIGIGPGMDEWTLTPVGDIAFVYSQQLRYVWRMTGATADGEVDNRVFAVTLNTLQWVITRTSQDTFTVAP